MKIVSSSKGRPVYWGSLTIRCRGNCMALWERKAGNGKRMKKTA